MGEATGFVLLGALLAAGIVSVFSIYKPVEKARQNLIRENIEGAEALIEPLTGQIKILHDEILELRRDNADLHQHNVRQDARKERDKAKILDLIAETKETQRQVDILQGVHSSALQEIEALTHQVRQYKDEYHQQLLTHKRQMAEQEQRHKNELMKLEKRFQIQIDKLTKENERLRLSSKL